MRRLLAPVRVVRLFVSWLVAIWRGVDETLPDIGPPYPEGSPAVAFQTGLHTLNAQQSQIQVLDLKNSLGATVALAVLALTASVLAGFRKDAGGVSQVGLGVSEVVLSAIASMCYVVAFITFWRDFWVRTYLGAPEQQRLREQANLPEVTEDQLHWAAAVSIEQAILVNDRHIAARIAAFKVIWILVPVGTVFVMAATIARLA